MQYDGIKYEEFCCKYLQNKGYSTRITVASGDQGADIIAEKDGIKIAVQCKYRTEGAVGNDAIQQALAGKMFYDCDLALVITNVDITNKARSAADKLKVKVWTNIKMEASDANEETPKNEADIEKENAALGPFVKGVNSVLSDLNRRIEYGKAIHSGHFKIDYIAYKNDEADIDDVEEIADSIRSDDNDYLKGFQNAQYILSIINSLSAIRFEIVAWFNEPDRDKSIFVFESKSIIDVYYKIALQKKLNEVFSFEVVVSRKNQNAIVVSVIKHDKTIKENSSILLKFISDYICEHSARSIISIDSKDSLVNWYQLDSFDFGDDDEDAEEYESFYKITSHEFIDDELLLSLENKSKSLYKRRLLFRKQDSHSFVLCIKKLIGLEDYLTVVDVKNFRGHDYSDFLSIAVGKCDKSLDFIVKLKKIDISRYDGLLKDYSFCSFIKANLEILNFYLTGVFDLTMIDWVKGKKLDLPLCIRNKRFYVEGIEADKICIKVVDSRNHLVFKDERFTFSSNELAIFPLSKLSYDDFIGNSKYDSVPVTGLNAMMIQKMIQDIPRVSDLLGDYYYIDKIKQKMEEYVSLIDSISPIFMRAYNKLSSGETSDELVICKETAGVLKFYYGFSTADIDNLKSDDHGYDSYIWDHYYFWKIVKNIKRRDLIWDSSSAFKEIPTDRKVSGFIEKQLSQMSIKYKITKNMCPDKNSFCCEIYSGFDCVAFENKLNMLLKNEEDEDLSGGHLYIHKQTNHKYVIILNPYTGKSRFEYFHLPLQKVIESKTGKPLSFWMIDVSIKPYCLFQSFFSGNSVRQKSLLRIKLKNVSIGNLERFAYNSPANRKCLWGAWNDLIYSLYSLLLFTDIANGEHVEQSYISAIELYDSKGIRISELIPGEYKYTYFSIQEIPLYSIFTYLTYIASLEDYAIEKYKNEIVPILNTTLQSSIHMLEELSNKGIN